MDTSTKGNNSWFSDELQKRVIRIMGEQTFKWDIPGTNKRTNPKGVLRKDESFLRLFPANDIYICNSKGQLIQEPVVPMIPEELTQQMSLEWWGTEPCDLSPRDSDDDEPRRREGKSVA